MSGIYSSEFQIPTTDVDFNNCVKPAAVLSWFQNYSTLHSEALNITRDYLVSNYHACWILVRVWFRFERPVYSGEQITVKTWCRGAGGVIVYRDFDFFCGDEKVGEGTEAWIIADLESRSMLRPASVENLAAYVAPDCIKSKQLKLIRMPKVRRPVYNRTVRYADLDVNGHMNNIRYADVIMDAFLPEQLRGKFVQELQLNYSQECKFGEVLEVSTAEVENGVYVDGCAEDGTRRFEAIVQVADI